MIATRRGEPHDNECHRWLARPRDDWVLKGWPDEDLLVCFAVRQRTTHVLDLLAAELLVRLAARPMSLDDLVAGLAADMDSQQRDESLRARVQEALAALQSIDLVDVTPC